MTDSLFLEEVVGFLHIMDDAAVTGNDLVQALDKNDALLSLPGRSEIALQLLDVTPIDDLFAYTNTDSDCTSVDCESASSSSSPAPVKDEVVDVRSRDAIRRSTYRQKQKAHRDELYKQVEDLSLQLTTLQQQKEAEKARQGMGLAHTNVWKALATRHLQARVIAEEQRRRLHQAVEKRSKVIQDLGLLVRKRLSEEQLVGDAVFPMKKPRSKSPDRALYEVYFKELDEIYAQTDKIFKDIGMDVYNDDDDVQGYYNPPPRRDVKNSRYHELVGKLSTPFNYEHVWTHFNRVSCMENRPGCENVEGPWVPADTTVTKVRIPSGIAGGFFVVHAIMRRYNEANRMVVIWRKFVEGEGVFAGMHSDETGWSIVRPSPADGCVGTVLESVIRFVPINFSSAASSGATVRQFTDAIIKAGEDDCRACIQKLEQMLLDDALGVC